MADRVGAKIDADAHTELHRLSVDYRIPIGEFTDMLLEYVMREPDRVNQAIAERAAEGA